MPQQSIRSLEIQGFRGFRHTCIDRLGRVNLIVGKNCAGKSSLLEALRLYAHRGSPAVIVETLESRDEYSRRSRIRSESEQTEPWAVRHLFYGRTVTTTGAMRIQIGPVASPEHSLVLQTSWYEDRSGAEPDQRRWHRIEPGEAAEAGAALPGMEVRFGDRSLLSYPLHFLLDRPYRFATWPPRIASVPCEFVPAAGLAGEQVGRLWDGVLLTPLEPDVVAGLRLIAPDVRRVSLLGRSERARDRIPVVSVQGFDEPIPLRSLGEGLVRLFGITLALVNAEGGMLLVDEVDSGLHYSVHSDLWRLVFRTASRLDVQVFATTHSWDCIEGFQRSAQNEECEDGMLIRLERRRGQIVPILFDERRLRIATRQDIEVR